METLAHPLVCFMGPSASGKTFISEKLLGKSQKVVTTTTRPPRPNETANVDYYFLTKENFEQLLAEDAFYETDSYAGNYYGTQKKEIRQKTADKMAFAIVTVPGFYALQKKITPIIPVYLQITEKEFNTRIAKRHLTQSEINKRKLEFAKEKDALVELKKQVPNLILINNMQSPKKTLDQLANILATFSK